MIESNIENVHTGPKPWLSIKLHGERVVVEGDVQRSLGRRIHASGRENDEGVFIDWKWDGRRLLVENDRFGLYPLFYCSRGGAICISPSFERVANANSEREFNFDALSVFFRMGHFIGEDTAFTDVFFLPPNSILTWEAGRLDVSPKQVLPAAASAVGLSFDEVVDTYRELFSRSIQRRLPDNERFTVPLSGGRDSRHILLELVRQGVRPRSCATVKYGPPSTNEDTRIAKLLTERLGIEHVEIEKPTSYFQAELKDFQLTNYCGGGHWWVQPVASYSAGRFEIIYDGLAGSVLSGGFMLTEKKVDLFRRRDFEALARLILEENKNESVLRNVFRQRFYERISVEKGVARLVRELREHAESANPVLSFVFFNRTRRSVASIPFAIFHQVPVMHVPYLDGDVFDFLSSLDATMVEGNRLHDEVIRRAYPAMADIPYENKEAKPVFRRIDRGYFRKARFQLFDFLRTKSSEERLNTDSMYLYGKIFADSVMRKDDPPWYLRPAIQLLEFSRLQRG